LETKGFIKDLGLENKIKYRQAFFAMGQNAKPLKRCFVTTVSQQASTLQKAFFSLETRKTPCWHCA